jgi:hypothetical protein
MTVSIVDRARQHIALNDDEAAGCRAQEQRLGELLVRLNVTQCGDEHAEAVLREADGLARVLYNRLTCMTVSRWYHGVASTLRSHAMRLGCYCGPEPWGKA